MMPNKPQPTQMTHQPAGPAKPTATMPPRKVYSREFGLEALRLLKSSGKTETEHDSDLVYVVVLANGTPE